MIIFFIAGLLTVRLERVNDWGAYRIPSGDRSSHLICYQQQSWNCVVIRRKLQVMHSKTSLSMFLLPAILGVLLFGLGASGGSRKEHPYRHSVVDIPISVAIGTVRSPDFSVPAHWYWIMVQVEKPLPFAQMTCMMGVSTGPLNDCTNDDPLLQAEWTLWEGDKVAEKGTIPSRCACMFTDKHIFKFLGNFYAEAGKKYSLEVKFTKDGTPLNVANPHLIIVKEGEQ